MGVDLDQVTAKLEVEGIASFAKSYDDLINRIAQKADGFRIQEAPALGDRGAGRLGDTLLPARQVDDERGPFARLALHANLTAVRLHDLGDDVEPEPHPPVVPRGDGSLPKRPKIPTLLLARDSDPQVGHDEPRGSALPR